MGAAFLFLMSILSMRLLYAQRGLEAGDLVFVPQNQLSKIRQFIPNTGLSLPGIP